MNKAPGVLYCANHPNVETSLRCSNCDKPICAKCAIRTPTGYRCSECVRSRQKIYDTTKWFDYPFAFIIAGALSLAGSFIVSFVGFFVFFIAPIAGVLIAEAVRFAVRRRRSKNLFITAAIGALFGALATLLPTLVNFFFGAGLRGLLGIIWPAAYAFIVSSTTYYRLRGIDIR